VLVVDDNATSREIVVRQTRSWDMTPVAVGSGAEALALLDAGRRFDVAVLDFVLPGMDGLVLADEIRQREHGRELPLVLITSIGRRREVSGEAGHFAAQLAKPLKSSQLHDALVTALATAWVDRQPARSAADDLRPTAPLRILLAEDNSVNQMVALRILEQLGYGADVAENGLDAIAALEREPYDVVLMDVQMPELDGLDATRRICDRWQPDERPRIIAMTANAMPEEREACFAAGMDDYVAKPIRPEKLAAVLGRVVSRSRP
jgi:CheY-like chemotaxis protein